MIVLISEAYLLLQEFCVKALNDSSVKVVLAHQFSSRPPKPCVVIEIDNCKDVSVFSHFVDESGLKTFSQLKTIDVTFTAYADKVVFSTDLLCKIYNMFPTELTFEVFGRNLALLKKLIDVTSMPVDVSDKIEDRAMMELRFNITQIAQYNTGLIEHVEMHDKINDEVYTIDK